MNNTASKPLVLLAILLFLDTSAFSEDLVVDFFSTHRTCNLSRLRFSARNLRRRSGSPLNLRYVRGTPHNVGPMPGLIRIAKTPDQRGSPFGTWCLLL
jgi:hypothetical protein